MDSIDEKLGQAGALQSASAEQEHALRALVASRANEVRQPRRRRVLIPAVGIGGVLALLGTGVAVATQWGPWSYVPEADIVIAREWTDVAGVSLGACESRVAFDALEPDVADAARHYLSDVDVDALEPNAEAVAAGLVSVGLPERMPQLVDGADAGDYDVTHFGAFVDRAWFSDARILQDALVDTVMKGMSDSHSEVSVAEFASFGARTETQCTTDPTDTGQ